MDAQDQKTQQQESRAIADRRGSKSLSEQQGSKCTNQSCRKTTNHSRASCFIRSRLTSRPHCLKKTSSMQLKRRDLHHTWLKRKKRRLEWTEEEEVWSTPITFQCLKSLIKLEIIRACRSLTLLHSEFFCDFGRRHAAAKRQDSRPLSLRQAISVPKTTTVICLKSTATSPQSPVGPEH